jgi:hypothetical protein
VGEYRVDIGCKKVIIAAVVFLKIRVWYHIGLGRCLCCAENKNANEYVVLDFFHSTKCNNKIPCD